jgi:hypothetical protein
MPYFITGASGSGKTACLPKLKSLLPDFTIHDFDDIGVPEGADKKWRQKSTEKWLQRLIQHDQNKSFLLGQMVLGEILACPSAKKLDQVNLLLLDCTDMERIKRLRKRGTYGVNQDTLNWASWLRMHCHDPQWEQRIIKDDCWEDLSFDRWDLLSSWKTLTKIEIIDTTSMTIDNVAQHLAKAVTKTNS